MTDVAAKKNFVNINSTKENSTFGDHKDGNAKEYNYAEKRIQFYKIELFQYDSQDMVRVDFVRRA